MHQPALVDAMADALGHMPFDGKTSLRELLEGLNAGGFSLDTLSMGMSADLEAAIAEGATLVRIGTAIFGERPSQTAATTG